MRISAICGGGRFASTRVGARGRRAPLTATHAIPTTTLGPKLEIAQLINVSVIDAIGVDRMPAFMVDDHVAMQGCWQLAGGHGQEVYQDTEQKLTAHAEAGFTTFE